MTPASRRKVRVAVGLGSNLGDREEHLCCGLRGLEEVLSGLERSPVYESDPVGGPPQPRYLNLCCMGSTRREPGPLLDALAAIERRCGRRPAEARNAPRFLDLDLLLYGERVVREPDVRVPHPRLAERPFVLVPLAEIAPEWRHPEAGRTVAELARSVGTRGLEAYEPERGCLRAADGRGGGRRAGSGRAGPGRSEGGSGGR